MRVLFAAAAVFALSAPALADELKGEASDAKSPFGHFVDQYRFGGTYDVVVAATADACEAVCTNERDCKAWSYTLESTAADSRCELKHVVGRGEYRPGTISGVSGAIIDPAVRRYSQAEPIETEGEARAEIEIEAPMAEASMTVAGQAVPFGNPPILSYDAMITPSAPSHKATAAPRLLTSDAPSAKEPIVFYGEPELLRHVSGSYTRMP